MVRNTSPLVALGLWCRSVLYQHLFSSNPCDRKHRCLLFRIGNQGSKHSSQICGNCHGILDYWILEETDLFTVFGFFMTSVKGRVTDAAAIRIWLTTVGPVITEASGTFLPANGSITAISFFARVVAKSTIFLCVFGEPAIARSDW